MKILIIDKVNPYLPKSLKKYGFEVSDFQNITSEEAIRILPDYDGIILRSKIKLNAELLSKCKKLKFISRVGAGMEAIDIKTAKKLGIKLINAPEGNRDAVGDHTVGLILSLFRKICEANNQISNGKWDREAARGIELGGKTVGIIGYGNMGSAFARRISAFGTKVIAYDKYKIAFSDAFVTEVNLKTIFDETDILSIHVPLTEETHFMVNSNFIDKFRKNFYLINTARGKIVKTSDLVEKLKEGKILGAGLDVLEYEKQSFEDLSAEDDDLNYLRNATNVIMTPHIAGITYESDKKLAEVIYRKIINFFENENDLMMR